MTGLAGIVYPDAPQTNNDLIYPMMEIQRHRTTNDLREIYSYKQIQIGICGNTFAHDQQSSIAIGLDGRLTNKEEIYKKLIRLQAPLKSKETSELLIHGYKTWGHEFFEHLEGEFAIVILDQNKRKLLLCRDRIGKKPLYWYQNPHFFLFSSEIKALLTTGIVPQAPARDAFSAYLYFGFIPQDMSPIQGVNKLLPAHYLQFHFDGNISIRPYWSYSAFFENRLTNSQQNIENTLDTLLKQSFEEGLRGANQVGCFLSSGIGSAISAHYASETIEKDKITAYSVNFVGENDEDFAVAKNIAATFGFSQETFSITNKNFLDSLLKIIWHLDEPLADTHILSTWELMAIAKKKSDVVVSSVGSHEIFANDNRYFLDEKGDSFLQKMFLSLFKSGENALGSFFKIFYKPLALQLLKESTASFYHKHYLHQIAIMDEKEIQKASPRLSLSFDPFVFFNKFYRMQRIVSPVASCMYFDLKTCLPDNKLIQLDKMAAAHSLQWRVPLLDRKIEEYLATLPYPAYKTARETGFYLKSLLKKEITSFFVQRQKITNTQFLKNWLTTDEMKKLFSCLITGSLVENGLMSSEWLTTRIARIDKEPFAFKSLWSVFVLEIWFRLFINQTIAPHAPSASVKDFF